MVDTLVEQEICSSGLESEELEELPREFLETKKSLKNNRIQKGIEATKEHYHVIQKFVILGHLDEEVCVDVLKAYISLLVKEKQEDQQKINVIDWLVFDPAQRAEALKESSAIIRKFLASKKHDATKMVFARWRSSALPSEEESAIHEHLCIHVYLIR
ncbi:hypothetical protein IRJ41_011271 [Triplophysa rosa]|uniref:Nuclear pore complex protein n=1 Tax=Triplophysa rosa TaxID=992332 RepID=A0A9W7WWP9_TRIRA|nr:hypothetical protein IRJ41_011271 [Triplophysa rosa]